MRVVRIIAELVVAFVIWWVPTMIYCFVVMDEKDITYTMINMAALLLAIGSTIWAEVSTKPRKCPVCGKVWNFMSARFYWCSNCRHYFWEVKE